MGLPGSLTPAFGFESSFIQDSATRLIRQNPQGLATNFFANSFVTRRTGTGTTDTIFNANAPFKFIITAAWTVMSATGAASDTVLISDGTNNITEALDVNGKAVNALTFFATINNTYATIAANGSLVVTRASAAPADVYIQFSPIV